MPTQNQIQSTRHAIADEKLRPCHQRKPRNLSPATATQQSPSFLSFSFLFNPQPLHVDVMTRRRPDQSSLNISSTTSIPIELLRSERPNGSNQSEKHPDGRGPTPRNAARGQSPLGSRNFVTMGYLCMRESIRKET